MGAAVARDLASGVRLNTDTARRASRTSSLLWKLNRLRSMGVAEIAYRTRQALQALAESRIGWGLSRELPPQGTAGAGWLSKLPADLDAAPYVSAADRTLAGHFTLFALTDARLGFPPRWNRDPKTGTDAPLAFGKTIDYRDERTVGDIKYLWELNRHGELLTLAQAWHLTGDRRYLDGCRTLLESWFDQCPYPRGPNWTSSLEHGLRLVNWAFSWQLLGGDASPLFSGASGAAFRDRWLGSVRQHCHFIAGHLSRHSSANNHLLGELMGLLVGSATWPLWPESRRWRDSARREFTEQALLQTSADGVNREQAIYYQHEVMDMMLVCGLIGRANGIDFGGEFWQRLERMTEFIAAMMDRGGNVPMIGDADDARIVRLDPSERFDPYRSLLATGAVLFERGDFKALAGGCDDKTIWLLGASARAAYDALAVPPGPALPRSFPEGGYHLFVARRGEPDEVLACVDCGPLGYLSIAAHGHADALSLTLSAAGIPLLVDPGTYAYHTQKKWRDYFRSTYAHNTVRIDGLDQSASGGNFLWLRKAVARCLVVDLYGVQQRFSGEHDGYRRLPDPVAHRRDIRFDATRNEFDVEDTLDCRGAHDAEICWHFSDRCDVEVAGSEVRVRAGRVQLTVAAASDAPPPRLLQGDSDPPAGWISRRYDVKVPAPTAVWRFPVRGPTRFLTRLSVGFQ